IEDAHSILWLTLNRADKSVNTFNEEVMRELDVFLNNVKQNKKIRAIVIQSGKKTGFIAGADIEQFKTFQSANEATQLIQIGQKIFQKLEDLPQVTIAKIEGFCLGGGLELALSCDYRIALESNKKTIGLPEVQLGIQPGWGGCVRLPDRIGAFKAFDLILSGRMLRPKEAKKMGIVDEAVPLRLLDKAVTEYATNKEKRAHTGWWPRITNFVAVRPLAARLFHYQVNKKVKKEHYPAPFQIINNWSKLGTQRPQAFTREAESIGELLVSNTSQNLVRVFYLRERLKSLSRKTEYKPKHIHVVGAGVMGGDIAAWCALRGFHVTVQDKSPELLGSCIKRTYELAKKQLKEKNLIQATLDRLLPDPEALGVHRADVILEAITEKLEVKQNFFKEIEKKANKHAILATNTSTIPLEEIGAVLKHPERLVGIHFFNPVALMPLVEVVAGTQTSAAFQDKAMAFVHAIDKLPLPVKSSPGFLVNRILLPYMLEAVLLLEEGISGPAIDKAAKDFGMPMGPIELGDTVGLDVCLAACDKLSQSFGFTIPTKLKEQVLKGELGKKTQKGFYVWKNGKPQKPKEQMQNLPEDIMNRMLFRMLNEAFTVLREGIVEEADLVDAGSIFGFGFPPFRGGVLHYAKQRGIQTITDELQTLESRYGTRFAADKGVEVL
ncbi:MAG TPA: 3-hydroxyacyl-CoA dehydrogenase NAD-binding domain-containing protein, partial [Gammaproteobacteria bacterium]|nr:3-hydroxyacyl-CoA dehydrogenase NAD-binding domain-containing protein [Gammaproteobacteria bacterium]